MLAAATAIGSTGLAAGGTVGALLGTSLAGTSAVAGLPAGVLLVGAVVGALVISRQAGRGRRARGLMLGYIIGAAGAATVIVAAIGRNLVLMLVGSAVLGAANSAVFMTRYAALDAVDGPRRGRALGIVFSATAVGAVLSPVLLGPSGTLAQVIGLPRLSGLYLVAMLAFSVAALVYATVGRRRAPWSARSANDLTPGRDDNAVKWRPALASALRQSRTRIAVTALATGNFIMVGIMTIAPVDMMMGGSSLQLIGGLIALHVAGMFGPSPASGYLADRFGPTTVVLLGCSLLLASCAAGMFAQRHGTLGMAGHLVLLGVGWNSTLVGGSTLLASAVPQALRPHAEGLGEVVMGLAAAVAAPVAGLIAAFLDYRAFLLVSAAIVICVLARVHRPRPGRENQVPRENRNQGSIA